LTLVIALTADTLARAAADFPSVALAVSCAGDTDALACALGRDTLAAVGRDVDALETCGACGVIGTASATDLLAVTDTEAEAVGFEAVSVTGAGFTQRRVAACAGHRCAQTTGITEFTLSAVEITTTLNDAWAAKRAATTTRRRHAVEVTLFPTTKEITVDVAHFDAVFAAIIACGNADRDQTKERCHQRCS